MPDVVRYTDASGATVYRSPVYPQMKGSVREASADSPLSSGFEDTTPVELDDPPSARPHDMTNHKLLGSQEYQDDDYRDRGDADDDTPSTGLRDMKNHEALRFDDEYHDDDERDHIYGDHDNA